nr:MAG TPA: hypothetical protein [Bacteriophage sp.]DAH37788.1 MAG TPA: hypothetical protein [Caudoviricetes sp.]
MPIYRTKILITKQSRESRISATISILSFLEE